MYSIGIDSGSRMTKFCLFDINKKSLIDYSITETKPVYEKQLNEIIEFHLHKNKVQTCQVTSIITTGYGRKNYSKATKFSSEIICHAKGVNYFNPNIKTIIDIGGQDSKVIKVNNGKVIDFIMNDKCAAGTGRFLEKVAEIFSLSVDDLGKLSILSENKISISSTCVVFAESEIIGLISQGIQKEDIISAVHKSIIHRVLSMANNLYIDLPIAFVGGVANNIGIIKILNTYLKTEYLQNNLTNDHNNLQVFIPDIPDITGALGAALSFLK
jgi:predicted CoA-substrate-specific enzyme activase